MAFSSARQGETLAPLQFSRRADGATSKGGHLGLEHFGLDSDDIEADVKRLTALGAKLEEDIVETRPGTKTAFLRTPDDVRIELIQKT